jgi:hypothetical protein
MKEVTIENILTFYVLTIYLSIGDIMGRKKVHRTKNELQKRDRIKAKRYYDKHKDIVKQKRMQRYNLEKKLSQP